MEVTNRILPEVPNLLSKKGIFYLVTIRQNKPGLFEKICRYTVFCRIHTPARTQKNPEGPLYSGLIRSKSNDVGRLRGFPNLQFRF